jgi:hypothetical protein
VRFDVDFSASRLRGFLTDPDNALPPLERPCVLGGSQVEQVRCMLELYSAQRAAAGKAGKAGKEGKGKEGEGEGERCVVAIDGSTACDATSVPSPWGAGDGGRAGQGQGQEGGLLFGNTYQFAYQPAMSMHKRSVRLLYMHCIILCSIV